MAHGFLVLCFDDGHEDAYRNAYPLLKKHDAVGVVGIISSFVGGIWRDWTYDGYGDFQLATLSQLRELREAGWEMASHSLTHSPHEWLGGRVGSSEYLEMMLRESKDWIVRNRLGDGRTFIYPFGSKPDVIVEFVKKIYWLGRSTSFNPPVYYDLPLTDDQRYHLWALPVRHPLSGEILHEIREHVRYATDHSAIIPLIFHRVTDQPRVYDVTPDELEAVLSIVVEEGIKTSTFEQVIETLWGSKATVD
jgi:peptidoglycan/xylan/chitin deacetylase (PgdA/CDA1 family)